MILEAILLVGALVAFLYMRFKHNSYYWTKLGVKQPKITPFPLGNNPIAAWDVLAQKKNQSDYVLDQYRQFKDEKYYGTYFGVSASPMLIVNDPELIRHILVKDFSNFVDRNSVIEFAGGKSKTDIAWQKQMTNLKGDEWRDIRATFSPIFTSGKLKMMVEFINLVSHQLAGEVAEAAKTGALVDMKILCGKYSMDTIASCAFGVDAGSFSSTETTFVDNARRVFSRTLREGAMFFLYSCPGFRQLIDISKTPIFKPKETEFFFNVIASTIRHRISSKTRRNDLIDLMLQAMKEDLSHDVNANEHAKDQFEKDSAMDHKSSKKEVDEVVIVATAMIMLIAGYDTTATTMSYLCYELARNQEIQAKLAAEIDEAFDNCDGENLDYNTVQNLPYLDMIISETLRLHNPAGFTTRAVANDYTLPGTNITLKKGHEVDIPIAGIHMDEKYYPNPHLFNPENFSKENKAKRSPYTFLAFGQGPRSCIGMRFALLEAKIGIVSVLKNHRLVTCSKTPLTVSKDPASLLGVPFERLYLQAEKRN